MIGVLAAAAGAAALFAATAGGAPVGTADKAAIEKVVRDYILANPEILPQAMEVLQARESSKAVAANRPQIETPFKGAWEGAADADVTLVQFFDYACGYCRQSLPVVERLVREDPKLKVVFREMPVLGPDSEAAAKISLKIAGTGQARYAQAHRALYAGGRPDAAARARVAARFGIAGDAIDAAVEQELVNNQQLQNLLRITGTPTWIVGDEVLGGAVGYDALKAAIAKARAD